MNRLFVIVFLIFSTNLLAQRKIVGRYRNHFGDRIELYSDSTFKYTWSFDLQYSWTRGSWTIKKDTVFFHMVPVYDTLSYVKANGLLSDKLILSVDEQPERIIKSNNVALQKVEKADFVAILQNTGGQNYQTYPTKLYFKKGRLYNIYQGSLVKKKVRGIWTRKKWRPWYFKSRD
jgi:hypothetical protein